MKRGQKLRSAIRAAHASGYRVTRRGILIGLKGYALTIALHGKQSYPHFSINLRGKIESIPIHRLASYCFYGEASLAAGIVTRHKTKNVLDVSKKNILIGSYSDNEMDKPISVRQRSAKLARASQPQEGTTAKLTVKNVKYIRKFYIQFQGRKPPNGSISALAVVFGVRRNAIAEAGNGKTWRFLA